MNKDTKDRQFNELMEKMYDKIYIFVGRGCSDRGFVEDVVQETFYEAYRKMDALMEHPNQIGWLYETAKYKKMRLGKTKSQIQTSEVEYNELDSGETEDEDYGEFELAETIKKTVSEKEYEMLRDYYVNGYSSVEIADKYGVNRGTIRMKMSRMKNKLKENLVVSWLTCIACIWRII